MNLVNNEDGAWTQAKLNIHQDLDTIQRTINQILAQINATPDPTTPPAAVIAPSNAVSVPGGISVKLPHGALVGNGLVTTPLGVNVDGTTITVNNLNQLVSAGGTVTVSPTGGLTGNGSVGSPLAVQVDGTTISINGSNQLTGLVNGFNKVTLSLTSTQIMSLDTVPIQVVAGVANKILVPVSVKSTVVMTAPNGYAFTTTGSLFYNSTGTVAVSGSVPVAFATGAGAGTWDGIAPAVTFAGQLRSSVNNAFGAGLYIKGSGANAGSPSATSTTVTLYYVIF